MTVEEFFTRAKDELVRSVLRRADAAVSQLRAHFEREKAALVEAVASRAAEDDATAKQGASQRGGGGETMRSVGSRLHPPPSRAGDKMTVDVRLEVIEGPYAGKVFVLHPRAVREGFLPGVKDSRHDPVRSYPPRALAVRTRVTVAQKVVPKIGRSTGRPFVKMGVSLPEDPEVSTTHGKFEARGGKVFFADLGSTNGTSLNAEDLTPHVEYELRDGDKLRVGATKMAVTVMVAEG